MISFAHSVPSPEAINSQLNVWIEGRRIASAKILVHVQSTFSEFSPAHREETVRILKGV